jgi:hypothetical protein
MSTIMKAPERFAGAPVVAAIQLLDDPSEHPHQYVVVCSNHPQLCSVHVIAFNGVQWTSGQGYYDLPWERAIDLMAEKAKERNRGRATV